MKTFLLANMTLPRSYVYQAVIEKLKREANLNITEDQISPEYDGRPEGAFDGVTVTLDVLKYTKGKDND